MKKINNANQKQERIKELRTNIKCHHNNIEHLIRFTYSKSKLKSRLKYLPKNYERTQVDDIRLLSTITNLHQQIAKTKQALDYLTGGIDES